MLAKQLNSVVPVHYAAIGGKASNSLSEPLPYNEASLNCEKILLVRFLISEKMNKYSAVVGLDYFGARYYDSELGHWTQPDPLWAKYPGWSPYNYALNNPFRYVDPDGRVNVYVYNTTKIAVDMNTVTSTVASQFTNAGVNNVNVSSGFVGLFKYAFKSLSDPESYMVKLDSYNLGGSEMGRASDGQGNALVNLGNLQATGNSDLETAVSNITSHEVGHRTDLLNHPKSGGEVFDDGSVMGTKVQRGTFGDKVRQFNPSDAKKLRDNLNVE